MLYIMPGSSLNTQTNREIRYEQRCQKKRIEYQTMERSMRAEKRTEITNEVTSAISMITSTRRRIPTRNARNNVSFSF